MTRLPCSFTAHRPATPLFYQENGNEADENDAFSMRDLLWGTRDHPRAGVTTSAVRSLLFRLESITHASFSQQIPWSCGVGFKLLAQLVDVDAQVVRMLVSRLTPDVEE